MKSGRGGRRVTAEVVADAVVVREGEFRVPSLEASFDMVLVTTLAIFPIGQVELETDVARAN